MIEAASTKMTPIRGWAPRGKKLVGKTPHGHWRTMTFIAALRCDRIDAPDVRDAPINALTFTAWIEQCLAPDLNPIEQVFAKALLSEVEGLKLLLRKAAERTVEATWRRIGSLLDAFQPHECANYLRNSGYAPT